MKKHTIRSLTGGRILFEANASSFAECVEQAVSEHIALHGADLSKTNFSNACLDEGLFNNADFSGCNLTGANLSEATLNNASFMNADLYNTCIAQTQMKDCNFEGASFGATDISGSNISGSLFSTYSCFSLDFTLADSMENCRFKTPDGNITTMSHPPVVIRGLSEKLVVFTDAHCMVGTSLFECPLPAFLPHLVIPGAKNTN